MSDNKNALTRYNSLFDNAKYQALAQNIANDLQIERDSQTTADIMNAVTDASLALCGHPSYAEALSRLAILCGQSEIQAETITEIHDYLCLYQQKHDTRAGDFMLTAHALRSALAAMQSLGKAISSANGIHSWRGRTAYHLFTACDGLMQTAASLLQADDTSYTQEKFTRSIHHITYAIREWPQHPTCADIRGIHFTTDENDS